MGGEPRGSASHTARRAHPCADPMGQGARRRIFASGASGSTISSSWCRFSNRLRRWRITAGFRIRSCYVLIRVRVKSFRVFKNYPAPCRNVGRERGYCPTAAWNAGRSRRSPVFTCRELGQCSIAGGFSSAYFQQMSGPGMTFASRAKLCFGTPRNKIAGRLHKGESMKIDALR